MATRSAVGSPIDLSLRSEWEQRFWAKVKKGEGCWTWAAYRTPLGYGTFNIGKKVPRYAHRIAFALANNTDAAGVVVCHRCDNPSCVRPDHLYGGTKADNSRDAVERGQVKQGPSNATHCVNGHEFTPENTRHMPASKTRATGRRGNTWRQCRTCLQLRWTARNARLKARRPSRTTCVNGHDLSNMVDRPSGRVCQACDRMRGAAYRERQRAS